MAISVEKKSNTKNGVESTANGRSEQETQEPVTVSINRHFTFPDKDVFDSVEWSTRDARAGDFFQADVEAPTFWTDSAVGIVAKLYFATIDGVRESSVKTLIKRVVNKISFEGLIDGYFGEWSGEGDENEIDWYNDNDDGCRIKYNTFKDELTYILLNQFAAFNSPVWFNLGVPGRKQCCSACFLLNVEDHLLGSESITEWITNEAAIFKSGAGAGVNLSKLRGSQEPLSTGGISSGPIPFIRAADASCGSVKSGNTRRGAKLVCLDVDHPDILDFIDTKVREDECMRILAENGINMDPSTKEGEKNIAESTSFQNANISVRLHDRFMNSINNIFDVRNRVYNDAADGLFNGHISLKNNNDEYITNKVILNKIAEAAWKCADPGVMFDDIINSWHTTPSLGRINTSNPCNEISQNDNTSCNLASMNLVKFLNDDNAFAFDDFYQVVDIMITAMDITCSFSELPTEKITENTRNLRQLGLGYSNLGSALMIQGMPYDSDEARDWTASVTSLMTGRAYRRSAEIADSLGPFLHWEDNKDAMDNVIQKHMNYCYAEPRNKETNSDIWVNALGQWNAVTQYDGFRNSQVTVIAPCGTISFYMDCDTTGCEPAYSLVSYKSLAGGGNMTLVNKSFRRALRGLGYNDYDVDKMVEYLKNAGEIPYHEFDSVLHKEIFQTAAGDNPISPDGHLKMVAAIQPHISGSISKTINCSEGTSVQDIYDIYMKAWEMGLKCVSVYRDGSKATQVLSTKSADSVEKKEIENSPTDKSSDFVAQIAETPKYDFEIGRKYQEILKKHSRNGRKRISTERKSLTIKFTIGDHEGYITAGMYDDGTLGEIFLSGIGKEGSTLKGMMDAWAISVSLGLQYGVPLEVFANKFTHMRFEPEGITNNKEIRFAKSIVDFIMKWLVSKFGDKELCEEYGIKKEIFNVPSVQFDKSNLDYSGTMQKLEKMNTSEKICSCGSIMQRVGTCYSCRNCGASTGCG